MKQTAKGFMKICQEAMVEVDKHDRCRISCSKHGKFHSTATILINLFVSSVLFASIKNVAPAETQWFAAILVLVSMSCAIINRIFKFLEREERHSTASKRYKGFIVSCNAIIAKIQDEKISDEKADALLDHHVIEFRQIISESPNTN